VENKLDRLAQLRKQRDSIDGDIAHLVTELSNIIQPKKRKPKGDAPRLPQAKM
jgi:hypothetical protein